MDSLSAQELFGVPAEWSDPLAYLEDATAGQGELLFSVAADILTALDSAQEYQSEKLKSAKAMVFRDLTKRSRADTRQLQRVMDALQEEIDGRLYRQSNNLAYTASGASLLGGVSRDLPLPGTNLPHEELEPGGPGSLPGTPPDTGVTPVTPGGPGPGDGLLGPPGIAPPANGLFPPLPLPAPAPAVPPGCPAPVPPPAPCPVNITVTPTVYCPPITISWSQLIQQIVPQLPSQIADILLAVPPPSVSIPITIEPAPVTVAPGAPPTGASGESPLACPPGDLLAGISSAQVLRVAPYAEEDWRETYSLSEGGIWGLLRAGAYLARSDDVARHLCAPDPLRSIAPDLWVAGDVAPSPE